MSGLIAKIFITEKVKEEIIKEAENRKIKALVIELNERFGRVSAWDIEYKLKEYMKEYAITLMKDGLFKEIESSITTEQILGDARQAFRESLKEKFINKGV